MIQTLSVENFAIIESVSVDLAGGFTVFSGETGAGKSLLVDAIQLALGGRADSDQVRSGHERALIKMTVQSRSNLLAVEREIYAEGRSTAKINGKIMPISSLRELGRALVDLHGQHDHQQLLNPETHGQSLDGWLGAEAQPLRDQVAERWDHLAAAKRRLESIRSGRREWERQIDSLKFQIEEIEQVHPELGEFENLELQIARLRHAEQLGEAVASALEALSDGEANGIDCVAASARQLSAAIKMDGSLAGITDSLNEAVVLLQEASHELRSYYDDVEANPQLLDDLQSRCDDLNRLRRKYGEDEASVLAHLERCQNELLELTDFSGDEDSLAAEVDRLEEATLEAAEKLSAVRRKQGPQFELAVIKSLKELAMERAQFEVSQTRVELNREGIDRVEFFFSANAGEPVKPLAKIASGGEMSRVMLAIKTALAGKAGVPTLVFDEVDAGLSGQAAAAMAKLLRGLGTHYQVLVISHLPQICAQADAHFKIEKVIRGGRTVTELRSLEGAEREEEIARLVAGEVITSASLVHARELLSTPGH